MHGGDRARVRHTQNFFRNFLVIIIILTPFFWLASPPRVFVTHTQNGYQNDRLGLDMCAMSFLRDSRVFREFIREKLRIISHKE